MFWEMGGVGGEVKGVEGMGALKETRSLLPH